MLFVAVEPVTVSVGIRVFTIVRRKKLISRDSSWQLVGIVEDLPFN